jgi:FKBP-type peptidyl-prolyl cis-trans isomerase
VGTEKRDRQRAARYEKTIAVQAAAKKKRNRNTALRVGIAVVVVGAVLFAISRIGAGDNNDSAASSSDEATTTTESFGGTVPEEFADPDTAAAVQARTPPTPAPFPADTPKDTLEKSTVIEGTGDAKAVDGDTLTVHYVGYLPDGTVFDQSWGKETGPFPFILGHHDVIDGWDQGLAGVKIGERRHLLIGSDLAYGSTGSGGAIPPDTPLAFDVDVVDINHSSG